MINKYSQKQEKRHWDDINLQVKTSSKKYTDGGLPAGTRPILEGSISFRPAANIITKVSSTMVDNVVSQLTFIKQRSTMPIAAESSINERQSEMLIEEHTSMFEEEDVSYLTKYLIEEQVQRDEYMITDGVQTIIDMMDQVISSKKDAQEALRSKRSSIQSGYSSTTKSMPKIV